MLNSKQSSLKKRHDETSSSISGNGEIQSELERILTSEFFKSSIRCQDFLKHVVWVACSESPESIKERTIGIAVFGRAPDYDTGADAIVRVKASEVRRRLAQYNQNADPQRPIAIELSPGSYAPKITRLSSLDPLPTNIIRKHRWGRIVSRTVVACLLLVLASVIYATSSAASPLEKFWHPFLAHEKPIICITHPGAYYLSVDQLARRGDASDAFRLSEKLQSWGRTSRIEIANDVSNSDLKTSPVILIGGPKFNHWTMMLTQDLRFSFQMVGNDPRIVDRDDPARSWGLEDTTGANSQRDYVVITRLVGSSSEKAIACIAGMTAFSTRVGTELIVDPTFLKKVSKFAPEDWDKKNLQFVIRITSDKGIQNPELVATTYW